MVTQASFGVPIWVYIVQLVNVILLIGFVALLSYAGWKVFRWLRKWNP